MRTRNTARAVLLDPENHVLLFEFVMPPEFKMSGAQRFWATPGGAIDPGEDAPAAVAREVYEETGLADFELGPELWFGEQTLSFKGEDVFTFERFFLVRAASRTIDDKGWTDLERKIMRAHRWWRPDALLTTTETVYPANFAQLVQTLLREGPQPARKIPL